MRSKNTFGLTKTSKYLDSSEIWCRYAYQARERKEMCSMPHYQNKLKIRVKLNYNSFSLRWVCTENKFRATPQTSTQKWEDVHTLSPGINIVSVAPGIPINSRLPFDNYISNFDSTQVFNLNLPDSANADCK